MSQAIANYHKLLSEMEERGFLPDRKCAHCQKPLQGEGDARPAESYLGTFTGRSTSHMTIAMNATTAGLSSHEATRWGDPTAPIAESVLTGAGNSTSRKR